MVTGDPSIRPRVAFVDLQQWEGFVQFAAALRRRGVLVDRVTVAPHSLWERARRRTQRIIFSTIDPDLAFDPLSRTVDLNGVSGLLARDEVVEAVDVVAEALARLPGRFRRAERQPSDGVLYDKLAMTRFAQSLGVAVPETWDEMPTGVDGWLVAKRRLGSSGADVRVVREPADLPVAWAETGGDGRALVQRFVHGEVVSVGGVAHGGQVLQAGCYRSEFTDSDWIGPPREILVLDDEHLLGVARTVISALGYTGAFCVDFVRAPDEPACLIDFNSRIFGSWLALQRAGLDIVGAYLVAHGWSTATVQGSARPGVCRATDPYRPRRPSGLPSLREVTGAARLLGPRWLLSSSVERAARAAFNRTRWTGDRRGPSGGHVA